MQTRSCLIYKWKDGQWDQGNLVSEHTLELNVYSSVLHYGQTCFEGLKAFRMKDGKVRIFRPDLNAERIKKSCEAAEMPYPSKVPQNNRRKCF